MPATSSFLATGLQYLATIRAPFYLVSIAGTISFGLAAREITDWELAAFPLFIILLISSVLAFLSKTRFDNDKKIASFDYDKLIESLEFSAAIGISVAALCLAFSVLSIDIMSTGKHEKHWFFWIPYLAALVQIVSQIIVYFSLRFFKNSSSKNDFVQLMLIQSAYLTGVTYLAVILSERISQSEITFYTLKSYFCSGDPNAHHILISLLLLSGLWILCKIVWLVIFLMAMARD